MQTDEHRRLLLKSLSTAGLLQGASLSGLMGRVLANGNIPIASGLRKVTGSVTVNGKAADVGLVIKPGDMVTTGPASEAVYILGDNAFLQRDNSSVVFGDAASGFFRIVTGKLLSVFGKGPKRLLVSTATIGIRGTGCYLETTPAQTYFCLCYGEAEIIPNSSPDQREVIISRHHDHPVIIGGDSHDGRTMAAAEVINHSDAELTLLENLVGRQPAFYGMTKRPY